MSHRKIRIWGLFGIVLIVFTVAFAGLPLMPNSTLSVIRVIARQRTIEQLIVKDVLIMAYRPTADHVQAISELQNALPNWEKVQNGLQNGDADLGISSNLPSDIKLLVLQSQSDFTSIDTSAHQILAHSSEVDQTQLLIILQHERAYSLTIFQVSSLFEDHILGVSRIYFGIGVAISVALLCIWIRFFRAMLKNDITREEQS